MSTQQSMFSKTCGLPTYTVGPHTVHMLATCYVALYKDNILFICQKMEFTDKKCFRSVRHQKGVKLPFRSLINDQTLTKLS